MRTAATVIKASCWVLPFRNYRVPIAVRSIIWEIWALSVDDREVDSVVVDEGETDELASEVRIGLSAGGGSHVRTRL